MKLTNKTLYTITKPVTFEDPRELELLSVDMMKCMDSNKGVGLAANQVGLDISLFVTNIEGNYSAFFNPKILQLSEYMVEFEEGCLSFPDEYHIIKRPESVKIEYQDYLGNTTRKELEGLECRVWLHEYDHLQGITFQQYKEDENTDVKE
tara:strand:- start:7625 stop:8074 length:450 start_codon:yes stop_codon:yes gene_type:complete